MYRGAYQFMQSTWNNAAGIAGRSDLVGKLPNLVAPADQDAVALALYRAAGSSPWGGGCS
jgi:muramidase (phage lysozyme)